ncbi:MAG: APC family permease [Gammaproteobacteria bacterium]
MLKRDISRTNVLIAAAGGMIGSGWLFSPYISAQIAGPGALISWVIAAIFMLFIALPLCELGTLLPISGGMTNYPTFTHGKEVGFVFAWISWLSYVVMTPIEIQAILQYGSHFIPQLVAKHPGGSELTALGYVVAIGLMFFVVLLNTFGIKLLAECNKYASLIKFILPSIAITALLYTANQQPSGLFHHLQFDLGAKNTWIAIFSALSTGGIAFAFTGFQNGLMLAGEVRHPQRDIPWAIIGAVVIGFVLYFMLQLSFLVAIPDTYLTHGWQALHFPGDSGPLVGLTLLLGLGIVAILLLFDASFSPFGTTLVYTAATSRIVYGMALNQHLPACFLKLNRFKIPTVTLYVNFVVGILSFLPFPTWQKMVAFLSSASILSYGIGPICLLALRKLQPTTTRAFRLEYPTVICQLGFYICNLMLLWCGFDILWKLYAAIIVGLAIHCITQRNINLLNLRVGWFMSYITGLLLLSYLSSFGGIHWLVFPWDMVLIAPFSFFILCASQRCLISEEGFSALMPPSIR